MLNLIKYYSAILNSNNNTFTAYLFLYQGTLILSVRLYNVNVKLLPHIFKRSGKWDIHVRRGQEREDCYCGDVNQAMCCMYAGYLFSAVALHLRMQFLLSSLCRGLCKRAGPVQRRPNIHPHSWSGEDILCSRCREFRELSSEDLPGLQLLV